MSTPRLQLFHKGEDVSEELRQFKGIWVHHIYHNGHYVASYYEKDDGTWAADDYVATGYTLTVTEESEHREDATT